MIYFEFHRIAAYDEKLSFYGNLRWPCQCIEIVESAGYRFKANVELQRLAVSI